MRNKIIRSVVFRSPFGWAGVAATGQGIISVILPKKDKRAVELQLEFAVLRTPNSALRTFDVSPSVLGKAVNLLQKYFTGERVLFDLPLDLRYYTRFQQAVWKAAAEIPYGETRSYVWIARRIKNPLASRAVGQAMGANPVPIVIP
jgi:O6-methylguanine-DNA--protein-cysteine methyltransferase